MDRRRGIMAAGGVEPVPEPNGLVPGDYSKGSSSISVNSNGQIEAATWNSSSLNSAVFAIKQSISWNAGDIVNINLKKISGVTGWKGWDIQLRNSGTLNLTLANNKALDMSKTNNAWDTTASAGGTANEIYMNSRSGGISNAVMEIHIKINGVEVF